MRIIISLIVYLLLSINFVFAQEQIDSLKLKLKLAKGEERADLLNDLAIQYRYYSLKEALQCANEAIQIAQEHNYLFGEGEGYKNRGVVYYFQKKYTKALQEYELAYNIFDKIDERSMISAILNNRAIISVVQGEYEKALVDYEQSIAVNIELGNWTSVANIYNNIGLVYSKWGNNEKTLENYNKSLEISIEQNNKVGMAAAYNNIAILQSSSGNLEDALILYQKAIKVNEEINDISGIARCLSNLSSVYTKLGQTEKAISLQKEALQYRKQLSNSQGVLKSYNDIGELLIKVKDYRGALEAFENSLKVAIDKNDKEQIIISYRLIGDAYNMLHDYILAIKYYNKSLEISKEIDNMRGIAMAYSKLGQCNDILKNYTKAIKYLEQSVYFAEKYSYNSLLENNYLLLSDLYKEIEAYKKALSFKSKYVDLHEKIYSEKNQEVLAELQTKFETERQEKEILQLKSEKQKIKQRNLFGIIISSAIVFIILMVLLYSRFLIKKKSLKLLDKKNELLQQANKDLTIAKEKAEESDRLKTAFLANISHEIRTPLNAIIGFSEFLVDPEISNEQKRELLGTISLNSDMLLNVIDDILDIAKIETGQLKINKEKVSINNLVTDTYLLMKDRIVNSSLDFKSVLFTNNDFEIATDAFRVKQALKNLIDNAIKFTKSGSVILSYDIINNNGKDYISFQVKDTGIGIDKKYHEKIFERFYKVPQQNEIYRGAGLGLSITKNIIEEMGGRIYVNSHLNKGSVFSFTIPF